LWSISSGALIIIILSVDGQAITEQNTVYIKFFSFCYILKTKYRFDQRIKLMIVLNIDKRQVTILAISQLFHGAFGVAFLLYIVLFYVFAK
jgi:hypothetical protein